MPEEKEDLAKEKEGLLAEVEVPILVMKVVVPKLQERYKKTITLEGEGHISVEEVMAEAEELLSSVIGAISGGKSLMTVLRVNQREVEEHMLPRWRKQKHHPKK